MTIESLLKRLPALALGTVLVIAPALGRADIVTVAATPWEDGESTVTVSLEENVFEQDGILYDRVWGITLSWTALPSGVATDNPAPSAQYQQWYTPLGNGKQQVQFTDPFNLVFAPPLGAIMSWTVKGPADPPEGLSLTWYINPGNDDLDEGLEIPQPGGESLGVPLTAVPEPATWGLLVAGLMLLGIVTGRKSLTAPGIAHGARTCAT